MKILPPNGNVITSVKVRLKDYLIKLENTNLKLEDEYCFNSSEFSTPDDTKTLVSKIKNYSFNVIYVFYLENSKITNSVIDNFKIFQTTNKELVSGKFGKRANVSRFNNTTSNVLYVGMKSKDFRSRVSNHLGSTNRRSYSMKINRWMGGINFDLHLSVYSVINSDNEQLDREIIELIEQEIWDYNKPVFGKRSGL